MKNKNLIIGASAFVILGIGALVFLKKKKNTVLEKDVEKEVLNDLQKETGSTAISKKDIESKVREIRLQKGKLEAERRMEALKGLLVSMNYKTARYVELTIAIDDLTKKMNVLEAKLV